MSTVELHSSSSPAPLSPEATVQLLVRVQNGDQAALDQLLERCIPRLRRWAHGRLPQSVRGLHDTADLVQDAVLGGVRRLQTLEIGHEGALQAFLRQCVMHRIVDILRYHQRRPARATLPDGLLDERTSPLEKAIGSENLARYEAALGRLTPADREAIVGRLELQYSYKELADALGKATPDAARVAVARAMKRFAQEIQRRAP